MNNSSSRFFALLALVGLACFLACDDDPADIVIDELPLLPVPSIEYSRPLANTDLTYRRLLGVSGNHIDAKVATAESTLTALVTAGVPVREAWATGHPPSSVFVTVRLARADTTIGSHGFSGELPMPWYPWPLDESTLHYSFGPPSDVRLPVKILEIVDREKPPGLVYRLTWWPDAAYYGDYVLEKEWRAGPESMIKTLIETGVEVRNAWVSATRSDCHWGSWRAVVLEVAEPHPVLVASGFQEGKWMDGSECLAFAWNYCFTDCPTGAELPRPREIWTMMPTDPHRIYWRSVPSRDYEEEFGRPGQAELHIMRMLRAGAPIQRAWIPVMASAREHTYMAIELERREWRVWWWDYLYEPIGGSEELNRWSFVKYYDLRDVEPLDEDSDLEKKHFYDQEFEGDP